MTGPVVVDTAVVVVPAATAAKLAGPLRALVVEHRRRNGGPVDPDVAALVDACERLAAGVARSQHGVADPGCEAAPSEPMTRPEPMNVLDVADLLGCTAQNVRALAARGSLPGRKTGSSWVFYRHDVDEYLTRTEA